MPDGQLAEIVESPSGDVGDIVIRNRETILTIGSSMRWVSLDRIVGVSVRILPKGTVLEV